MSGLDVKPELDGSNLVLVVIVGLIALAALGMAVMFRKEVLAAGEGTDNMKNIAKAIQEGANAYLARQFRTLAIFASLSRTRGVGSSGMLRKVVWRSRASAFFWCDCHCASLSGSGTSAAFTSCASICRIVSLSGSWPPNTSKFSSGSTKSVTSS